MSLAMTQAECQDFLVEPHVGVICVVNLQSFASRGMVLATWESSRAISAFANDYRQCSCGEFSETTPG